MGFAKHWLAIALTFAVVVLPEGASAKPSRDGVRLDPLQPAPPESCFARAQGPHVPTSDAVEFAVSLGLEYSAGPLRAVGVDTDGGEETVANLVDHALLTRIGASIAPANLLSVDMSFPIALFIKGDASESVSYGGQQVQPAKSGGIGDLRFGLHFRPVDAKSFGLVLGGNIWAPVGTAEAYMSDKRFRGEVDIGVAGEVNTLLYGSTISIGPAFFAGRDGDRVAASLALHVRPVPGFSMGVEPTVALFSDVYETTTDKDGDGENDEASSLKFLIEPLAAFRFYPGRFRIGLSAGPVFGKVAGAGQFQGLFTIAFVGAGRPDPKRVAPQGPKDRDLDKIPDSEDACPDEAGPDSRDEDQRGCPAQDSDGDRVRDVEDTCPQQAGVPHVDAKANGCPDRDNDLIPDPIDSCAAEPGAEPFGCPKYARMTKTSFKITPPIQFKDAELTAESRAALEEVAATMRANPKIEQISVLLGTKGAKDALSDDRAKAILVVFRAGNLDASRYEVVYQDDMRAGTVNIKILR